VIDKVEMDLRVCTLKARFPYQFEGARLGLYLCAGWMGLFEKLCEDIDQALGEDKLGFHWDQVKEKYGSARFYFQLGAMPSDLRMDLHTEKGLLSKVVPAEDRPGSPKFTEAHLSLVKRLRKLSIEAEMATQHSCAVCGQAGDLDRSQPWIIVLCDEHKSQRAELVKEGKDLDEISLKFD
jgi:hypothetical protein